MSENVHTTDEIELRDLILIFWKRRWMVIGIPIIVAVIVFAVGKMAPPVYTSTAKISLGSFNYQLYNDPNSVQQLLTSQDMLDRVAKELNDQKMTPAQLAQAIKVTPIANTNIVQIDVNDSNPQQAQKINEKLVSIFIQQSNQAYDEKKKPLEQYFSTLQHQYSLARDEIMLSEIGSRLNEAKNQLVNLQKAVVIENPSLPAEPQPNKTLLKTAVAFVGALMFAFFLALLMEYFAKNPLRFNYQA